LLSTGELNYKSKMPGTATLLNPALFDKSGITEMKRKKLQLEGYPALSAGQSCNQVRCSDFDLADKIV
jgi:hypothetical protein